MTPHPDVIVVGSVNADVVLTVDALPAPGETVIGAERGDHHGGKGANAAVAAARLGARVALVAAVGDDDDGRAALADLEAEGVDVSAVAVLGEQPTGVAHITVDRAGENTIVVASGANAALEAEFVTAALERLAGGDPVVLADLEVPDAPVAAAAASGLRFVLDPAPARALADAVVRACTVLTPNGGELEVLGDVLARGAGALAVTLGAEGAELRTRDETRSVDPYPVEAVDATGAGDAFAAALAVALAGGAELPDAVAFAAAAGALATRAAGARAGYAGRDEVEALVASRGEGQRRH